MERKYVPASDGPSFNVSMENEDTNSAKSELDTVRNPATPFQPAVKSPFVKPPYSYVALICMAIESTPERRMTVAQIYRFIEERFPYYRHMEAKARQGWQNSIRHNLSLNGCFQKVPRDGCSAQKDKKGNFWIVTIDIDVMFEPGNYKRRRRMNRQPKRMNIKNHWPVVQQPCFFAAPPQNSIDIYQVPPNVVVPQVHYQSPQCQLQTGYCVPQAGAINVHASPFYLTAAAAVAAGLPSANTLVNSDPSTVYAAESMLGVQSSAYSQLAQTAAATTPYGGRLTL